jgi:hypothetical protein
MKRIILAALILISACSKKAEENPVPVSDPSHYYKDLGNFELDYNHSLNLDMNADGVIDFAFATNIISDYLGIEKLEFRAYTLNGSLIYNKGVVPKVFNESEKISTGNTQDFNWTRTNIFLATRVYSEDPSTPEWHGAWKDKTNKYLAVKVKANDKFYTGWIRMSIGGIHSKIILHDYAFNKIADADINAGAVK